MYAKVFSQIFDGTLCTRGPWEALVTFQQLLVLADQDGVVDMTASAISRRTTIPLEIIEKGIAALLLPDPESRTPTEQGRRIIPLSEGRAWGWLVVNYVHYRQLKREDDRRAYHREYWHKRKLKDTTQTQHTQPNQPIAEAKAEAEANAGNTPPKPPRKRRGAAERSCPEGFEVTAELRAWATQDCPRVNIDRETAKFRDHEFAKAKTDWVKTWRNWMRRAHEVGGASPGISVLPSNKQEALEASNRKVADDWAAEGGIHAVR